MTAGIVALPRHRLDQSLASTSARWHDAAGNRSVLAVILILSVIASRYSEVDPGNLCRHLSGLTSYFGRIPLQTSDEHFAADVADWYWNIFGWSGSIIHLGFGRIERVRLPTDNPSGRAATQRRKKDPPSGRRQTRIAVFSPDVSETRVQDEIVSALLGIGLVAFEIVDRRFDLFTGLLPGHTA